MNWTLIFGLMALFAAPVLSQGTCDGSSGCSVISERISADSPKHYLESTGEGMTDGWYCKVFESDTSAIGAKFLVVDGMLSGEYRAYYMDGSPFFYSVYCDGLKNGMSVSWHEDGSLESLRWFQDGKMNGPYFQFDERGKLVGYSEWYKSMVLAKDETSKPPRKSFQTLSVVLGPLYDQCKRVLTE